MKLDTIKENLAGRLGITDLTPVQNRMTQIGDKSLSLIAPTGSGKTVAFAIASLSRMADTAEAAPRLLVIAPTRELARQVADTFRAATAATPLKTVVCSGGHSFSDEKNSLASGADIVVGTPGRLLDHINRDTLDCSRVGCVVLDEYDKSLELGFENEMKRIFRRLPRQRRLIVTSATRMEAMPQWVEAKEMEVIETAPETAGEPSSKLDIAKVTSYTRDKLPVATQLLIALGVGPTIVFVNHRESAERVHAHLACNGLTACVYHGGLEQNERENALEMFANGSAPIMVATDLGARGIDVTGVANVVHYNLPVDREAWIHRNGRTGRMGADGAVYVIAGEEESLPDYIVWDREWQPSGEEDTRPCRPKMSTLLFSLGKKEKISKGDIVGFLIANAGLTSGQIGRITLRDHTATAAVERQAAKEACAAANKAKIKRQRVKVTLLNP